MRKVSFISIFMLVMLSVVGCGKANTLESVLPVSTTVNDNPVFDTASFSDNAVSQSNSITNSSYYSISFIGDAFDGDRGLASVVLENGDVCVINEEGSPLAVVSNTRYSEREEQEMDIPYYMSNGCFVFSIYNEYNVESQYLFSHDGTLLKHLIVGTSTGCDALQTYYGELDAFYWLSTEGGFDTISYILNRIDADGNISSQEVTVGDDIHDYMTTVPHEDVMWEMEEKIRRENSDLNVGSCLVKDDGSAIVIAAGMDKRPYYAYASKDGVLTSEMTKLDADVACFCGKNILMMHRDPESPFYGSFSMLNLETGNITDLNFYGTIDGTNSRYALRPFAETGETLETGQVRRTNFIRPDGTLLFQKDSYGNTVIEIPDSVPRY